MALYQTPLPPHRLFLARCYHAVCRIHLILQEGQCQLEHLGGHPLQWPRQSVFLFWSHAGRCSTACSNRQESQGGLWFRRSPHGTLFETIRKDPNLLLAFLREMPKGGDLHNHLWGAVYAESLIQWAAENKDCIDPKHSP